MELPLDICSLWAWGTVGEEKDSEKLGETFQGGKLKSFFFCFVFFLLDTPAVPGESSSKVETLSISVMRPEWQKGSLSFSAA